MMMLYLLTFLLALAKIKLPIQFPVASLISDEAREVPGLILAENSTKRRVEERDDRWGSMFGGCPHAYEL